MSLEFCELAEILEAYDNHAVFGATLYYRFLPAVRNSEHEKVSSNFTTLALTWVNVAWVGSRIMTYASISLSPIGSPH